MITVENKIAYDWAKRLTRKGPFYLYETFKVDRAGRSSGTDLNFDAFKVIWNVADSTKIGYVHDGMWSCYGIQTIAVLRGERPHDLWNGRAVTNEEFDAMLAVRQGASKLPTFDLFTLKDVR